MMTIASYAQDGFTRYSVGDDQYSADDVRRQPCTTRAEALGVWEQLEALSDMASITGTVHQDIDGEPRCPQCGALSEWVGGVTGTVHQDECQSCQDRWDASALAHAAAVSKSKLI